MTDTGELRALLALRRQLLLDITDLIGQLEGCPHSLLSSPEYRLLLGSVQRSCHTRERVFEAGASVLPSLRQELALLGEEAETLKQLSRRR